MVQSSISDLDASFGALADATRRGVLEHLATTEATISDLAAMFGMSLTGMQKHVAVLERAGLATTEKLGRVRICRLSAHSFAEEAAWIQARRHLWNERFEALDTVVEALKRKEAKDGKQNG